MSEFLQTISSGSGILVFLVVQVLAIFIIPFGVPGTLVQAASAAVMTAATGRVGWVWTSIFFAIAITAEVIEFFSSRWGAKKFGGSKKAAWGALIGGFAGAFIGVPVPIIGSIIGVFIGTFAGAVVGEMIHLKSNEPNLRVGMGAVIGLAIGMAVKMSLALIMLIISVVLILR